MLKRIFYILFNKVKLYNSIDTIPVYNFFKIYETNDLRYLAKISDIQDIKYINVEKCKLLWDKLQEDYLTLVKDNSFQYFRLLQYDVMLMRLKFNILKLVSDVIVVKDLDPMLVNYLKLNGIKYINNRETDSKEIRKKLQQLHLKILIKENELKALNENENENSQDNDIYKIISALEDWKKFNIDITTLSLKKFVVYCQEFEEYCKNIKKANGK
jgi:hypothetical protein